MKESCIICKDMLKTPDERRYGICSFCEDLSDGLKEYGDVGSGWEYCKNVIIRTIKRIPDRNARDHAIYEIINFLRPNLSTEYTPKWILFRFMISRIL